MQQYLLTEDQKGYIQLVKDFFTKEVLPIRAEYDEEEKIPMATIHKLSLIHI